MGDLAVRVAGLGKQYRLGAAARPYLTLRDQLRTWAMAPLRFLRRRAEPVERFWALQDVSFEVRCGEVIGIIGRNGAGKSTLLKILSRITEPTAGEADIHGRVGSLLEVGTGFHPELTGRENIYLNGAILGMRRAEIARKFDEIVAFAGVEKFIDTPAKHYSSGMYTRLAFAVAAHLEPEILIVDEVLAVGDTAFQKKCLGKMQDIGRSGRTVLFVSHNMSAVAKLCSRAVVLEQGRATFTGPAAQAVEVYEGQVASLRQDGEASLRREGSGEYRYLEARPEKALFRPEERKRIVFRIGRQGRNVGHLFLSGLLRDAEGAIVLQLDSRLVAPPIPDAEALTGELTIAHPWLKPGEYHLDLWICSSGFLDKWEDACQFFVSPVLPYPFAASEEVFEYGLALGDFHWTIEPIPHPPHPTDA